MAGFYQPEFDHLGMQPLFGFEILQDSRDLWASYTFGAILGWQYRYEQFKSRYDRSTFAFANTFYGPGLNVTFGPFASWSPSTLPLEGGASAMNFIPSSDLTYILKESPCELNNLMSVSYDPTFHAGKDGDTLNYVLHSELSYQTDPLIHHALIHYKKMSTMSSYSMPKLND